MPDLVSLGGFIAGFSERTLPTDIRAHCGVLVADNVACTLGALRTPEGRAMARALYLPNRAGNAPPASYRAYVSGDLLSGVYIDSSLANLLDFDDVYEGSGHIGCMVVPVAFRVGAFIGSGGPDVLAAIAAGFEVGCRFAEATRPGEAARQQVWGIGTRLAPAAAAVAARLLGLPPDATAHAVAMACATAPLPSVRKTVYGDSGITWVKNNMGIAAAAGVSAALLAREGARGPLDILDGPVGFARMIGTDSWRPHVLFDELGTRWWVAGLGLKPYPCCRHAHAVIDAARAGLTRLGVPASAVSELTVAGPVWIHSAPFTNPAPATMLDAQYSLPYCLAAALLDLEPGLAWFDPGTYARPEVQALASRVRTADEPASVGRVTIAAAGRSATVEVDAPRGSPAVPLTGDERRAKFLRLTGPILPLADADVSYAGLHGLERYDRIGTLIESFRAADLRATGSLGADTR